MRRLDGTVGDGRKDAERPGVAVKETTGKSHSSLIRLRMRRVERRLTLQMDQTAPKVLVKSVFNKFKHTTGLDGHDEIDVVFQQLNLLFLTLGTP